MGYATVTGDIKTISGTIANLPGVRLRFIPSGNAINGSSLIITEPATATLNATTGAFTVSLLERSGLTAAEGGDFYYYPRIEWLDPAGQYTHLDFIKWKIYVPVGGGALADFIQAPAPAGSFVLGFGPPPSWLEDVVYINMLTGDIYSPIGSLQ